MAEVDISNKVKNLIKFGIPTLILIAVATASIVWYVMYGWGDMTVREAMVSSNMVGVRTRISGSVEEILVEDGQQVEAGTVIARMKVNVTEEQVKQLEQNLALSQRNLEQIKKGITVSKPRTTMAASGGSTSQADVARAKSRMDRMNQLYEMGAISAVKRDEAVAAYQTALADSAVSSQPSVSIETTVQPANPDVIKQAELQVKQAQAALAAAKNSSAANEIVAPVSGVVYLGDLAEGAELNAGDVVARIGSSADVWVEAYIDAVQSEKLQLGEMVTYYIDRQKYEGLITDIVMPQQEMDQSNTEGGYVNEHGDKVVVKISIPDAIAQTVKIGENAEVRFPAKK